MSFIAIAAAASGLLAAGRTIQLKKEAETIETQIKGAIHSIKADGLHVRLDVKLKNPSKTPFTFSFPFLKLISSRGNSIGSSQADNSVIELKAGEEQMLKPIMLTIPLSEILSLSIEVFKAITEGKTGLKIDVVTSSYAHLLFGAVKHKVEWHNMITLIRDKTDDKK